MIFCKIFAAVVLLAAFCESQDRGFMMVFLNTNPDRPHLPKESVDSLQAGHRANMERLANDGRLLIAGPFHGGGGLFVFSTSSVDSSKNWLATDPAIQAGRFKIEMLPYDPRIGGICRVGEEYEMTKFRFVRYGEKTHASPGPLIEANEKHRKLMKSIIESGRVVAEGTFPDGQGGILVGTFDESVVTSDLVVKNEAWEYSMRTLWIARGSFCEE